MLIGISNSSHSSLSHCNVVMLNSIVLDAFDVSVAEVYGVVTFYSQFNLYPKGEYRVSVCMGTACYVKGAGEILDKLKELLGIDDGQCTPDGRFSLDATRCIGCCGLAPVLTVNDVVYPEMTPDKASELLKKLKEEIENA